MHRDRPAGADGDLGRAALARLAERLARLPASHPSSPGYGGPDAAAGGSAPGDRPEARPGPEGRAVADDGHMAGDGAGPGEYLADAGAAGDSAGLGEYLADADGTPLAGDRAGGADGAGRGAPPLAQRLAARLARTAGVAGGGGRPLPWDGPRPRGEPYQPWFSEPGDPWFASGGDEP